LSRRRARDILPGEEDAMFSIPLRTATALAAFGFALLAADPADAADPRLQTYCAPSYAPEGFPCRALEPGKTLVLRFGNDLPGGAILRFVPSGSRGNRVAVRVSSGPVQRNKSYRVTLPSSLCTSRKKTPYDLEISASDSTPVGPGGQFMVLC
jgi:hypothetical protein